MLLQMLLCDPERHLDYLLEDFFSKKNFRWRVDKKQQQKQKLNETKNLEAKKKDFLSFLRLKSKSTDALNNFYSRRHL